LPTILVSGCKNALEAVVDKASQRVFELLVRFAPFELKEIKVMSFAIEVESVEAIVVIPECDARDGHFLRKSELAFQVKQREVVVLDTSTFRVEVRIGLINIVLADSHGCSLGLRVARHLLLPIKEARPAS
jgi:hypothetical protein